MASVLETFFILFKTDAKRVQSEIEGADASAHKLATDLDKAGHALKPGDVAATGRALGEAGRKAKDLGHDLDDAGDDAAKLERNTRKAKVQLSEAEKQAEALGRSFGNMINRVIGLAGAYLGGREIIRYADEYKNLQTQIKLTTKTQDEFNSANEKLYQVAQKSRQGTLETVQLYASLQRSTEKLGYSQDRLLGVTETINKAITVSGTSADSARAALMQLGQGFASGTLRGEELNSVLEQAPRLAKAIADGMGVEIGQLRALGEAGSITADKVFQALEKSGPQIRAEFEKVNMTVGQSMTTLRNATVRFIGQFDAATGATAALSSGLTNLADSLGDLFSWLKDNRTLIQGFGIGLLVASTVVTAFFIPALWGMATAGWAALAPILIMAAPFIAIGAAVLAAAAAFALLWEDVQAFLTGQPSLLGDLVNKYEWVADTVHAIAEAWKFLAREVPPLVEALGEIVGWVFARIWEVAQPIIEILQTAFIQSFKNMGTVLRFLWAVFQEIFGALWPYVEPVLKLLGGGFSAVAKQIFGEWKALFDWFVARLNDIAGAFKAFAALTEGGRKALEAATPGREPGKPGAGAAEARATPGARASAAAGQRALANARTNPLAASTPSAVAARGQAANNNTRSTNVHVGKVEVHTQATDADGMAKAASGALGAQLRRTTSQHDDGVDR